jgi:hypothetical protein
MADTASRLKRSGRNVSEKELRPKQWFSHCYEDDDMPPNPPAAIATGPPGGSPESMD